MRWLRHEPNLWDELRKEGGRYAYAIVRPALKPREKLEYSIMKRVRGWGDGFRNGYEGDRLPEIINGSGLMLRRWGYAYIVQL